MGMLPNSQYGSVAVMPSLTNVDPSNVVVLSRNSSGSAGGSVGRVPNEASQKSVVATNTDSSNRLASVNSDLSALVNYFSMQFTICWKSNILLLNSCVDTRCGIITVISINTNTFL